MEKKLNTTKQKKLNSIKSEIQEITDFVTSNDKKENFYLNKHEIEDNLNDTFTLTNIVNSTTKVQTTADLVEIKNEMNILKSMLIKQEVILKEILLKMK